MIYFYVYFILMVGILFGVKIEYDINFEFSGRGIRNRMIFYVLYDYCWNNVEYGCYVFVCYNIWDLFLDNGKWCGL